MTKKNICRLTGEHDWKVAKAIDLDNVKIVCLDCQDTDIVDKLYVLVDGLSTYKK